MRLLHRDMTGESLRRRIFGTARQTSQSTGKSRSVIAAGLFSDFAFTWNSVVYDETTVNTGLIAFNALRTVTGALFGTQGCRNSLHCPSCF